MLLVRYKRSWSPSLQFVLVVSFIGMSILIRAGFISRFWVGHGFRSLPCFAEAPSEAEVCRSGPGRMRALAAEGCAFALSTGLAPTM
jgi:hypothetical protein